MAVTFERPRLHDQVLEHMTQLIAMGQWSAGTVLPGEGELAKQLKVSRTVVRECVRVLASRGMVDVHQGRGITVRNHAAWNVTAPLALLVRSDQTALLNWLEVRTLLEMDAAGLAAVRATDDDRAALQQIVEELARCDDDPDAYRILDIRFHVILAQATHNPALVRLLEGVIQPLREQLEERDLTPQTRHTSTEEHAAIVACLGRRDSHSARTAMSVHLGRVADEINRLLQGEGGDLT